MSMIQMAFTPWRKVKAERNLAGQHLFLQDVARSAHQAFRAGSEASRGGTLSKRGKGTLHRASAAGDWPAKQTGRLLQSIRTVVTLDSATIGTAAYSDKGFPYSMSLRTGFTARNGKHIGRRKMSDDAIKMGIALAKPRKQTLARFRVVG